jgi:TrpR-related protein YerC/YecD
MKAAGPPLTVAAPAEPAVQEAWMTEATVELARAIVALRNEDEALRFLRDLCTIRELVEFTHRWQVARLLEQGVPYHEISDRTGASSATISRVNQWRRYGRGGYQIVLARTRDAGAAPAAPVSGEAVKTGKAGKTSPGSKASKAARPAKADGPAKAGRSGGKQRPAS